MTTLAHRVPTPAADLHGAIRGVAALYSGFVTETIVVRWRMGRSRVKPGSQR